MNASTRDTTLAPAPTVGHYRIDPVRTTVRFSTPHLLGLGAIWGTVRLRESHFSVTKPYPRRCTPSWTPPASTPATSAPPTAGSSPSGYEVRYLHTTPLRGSAPGSIRESGPAFQIRTPEPRRMP